MHDRHSTALRTTPTVDERTWSTSMRVLANPRLIGVLGAIAVLLAAGCSGGDSASDQPDSGSSGDRAAVVAGLVDDVVGPAHRAAAEAATTARTAVHDACPASGAPPSAEVVEAARAAAAAGNDAWEALDPIDAGPIMERRTGSLVGYKVDPAAVDQVLATTPPSDVETVTERTASPRRGYGALIAPAVGGPRHLPRTALRLRHRGGRHHRWRPGDGRSTTGTRRRRATSTAPPGELRKRCRPRTTSTRG